jgi:hypothetical protein
VRNMKAKLATIQPLNESGVLAVSEPSGSASEEGQLLIHEAKDYIAEPPPEAERGEPRAEAKKKRLRKYSGDRVLKEEPKRYRLIAAMLTEGVSIRQISRACLCDTRTVRSVQRREAESVPSVKTKLISTLGKVATMTAERLEEEIPRMNHAQLAVCCGIATDKLNALTNDPKSLIEINVNQPQINIFEAMNALVTKIERSVQGRVMEPATPFLTAE